MKSKGIFFKFLVLFIITVIFFNNSCKKDEQNYKTPELPPQSTMMTNFSDFNTAKKGITLKNFGRAATHIVVWNTILTIGLVVPVTAFVESFKHEVVKKDNNLWVWSYNFNILLTTYLAELEAKYVNGDIQWDMYISQTGGFQRFHWFTGTSKTDGTSGTWRLYESNLNQIPFVDIVWNRNTDGTADIKYINVKDGDKEKGAYITYGLVNDAVYNNFYNVFSASLNLLVEIKANSTNKSGRIKDTSFFPDQNWHCWDTKTNQLQDITCQ